MVSPAVRIPNAIAGNAIPVRASTAVSNATVSPWIGERLPATEFGASGGPAPPATVVGSGG